MKIHKTLKLFKILILLGISTIMLGQDSAALQPTKVFLVRHAEKQLTTEDPGLNDAGKTRAIELAQFLKDAQIQYVHSSNYTRTIETVRPFCDAQGLTIEIYDPRNLDDLKNEIIKVGGNHLVVGHSNTTPTLTQKLGGDPHFPIEEKREYDRMYIVTLSQDGNTSSVLLRYGKKFLGADE